MENVREWKVRELKRYRSDYQFINRPSAVSFTVHKRLFILRLYFVGWCC